jgi:hypothetical protein
MPLHCYLARARFHPATGIWDDEGDFEEDSCAHPTGDIDIHTVQMLIDAHPDALVCNLKRSPLHILCEGCGVTFELMKMLIDRGKEVFKVDGEDSPLLSLMYNEHVRPFPTDVFQYMLEQNDSDMNVKENKNNFNNWPKGKRNIINVAIENTIITPEVIWLLVDYFPRLVEAIDPMDRCIPLHLLCKNYNKSLEEDSAILILKILVLACPRSLLTLGEKDIPYFATARCARKRQANQIAEKYMSFEFNKVLLSQYSWLTTIPSPNILQLACRFDSSLNMIKILVEDNSDLLMMEDGNANVALHTAVRYATPEVVGYLVTAGQMALTKQNKQMEVPLHTACTAGRCRAVKYLVERNRESLLLQDKDKEVALHKACRKGTLQTIRYIMEKNMAAVQIRNQNNELPVHVLCNRLNEVGNNIKDVAGIEIVFRLLRAYPETMIV